MLRLLLCAELAPVDTHAHQYSAQEIDRVSGVGLSRVTEGAEVDIDLSRRHGVSVDLYGHVPVPECR